MPKVYHDREEERHRDKILAPSIFYILLAFYIFYIWHSTFSTFYQHFLPLWASELGFNGTISISRNYLDRMISSCYTIRLPPNSVFYSVVSSDRREEAQLLFSRVLGKSRSLQISKLRDPTCLIPSGPTLNLPSHTHLTSKIVNRKKGTLSLSHINVLLINYLNHFLGVGKLKMSLKHKKSFRNWPGKAVSKRTLLHLKSIVPRKEWGEQQCHCILLCMELAGFSLQNPGFPGNPHTPGKQLEKSGKCLPNCNNVGTTSFHIKGSSQ